jgi:hypothetical protein
VRHLLNILSQKKNVGSAALKSAQLTLTNYK